MNGITIRFEIDNEKATEIARVVYEQFENREGIFANYSMPEYVYPRNLVPGSKEHALYFYLHNLDRLHDRCRKIMEKGKRCLRALSRKVYPLKKFCNSVIILLKPLLDV